MGIEETLLTLETELLDPTIRKNAGRLDQLLADDFREFGSSGRIFSKSEVIQLLQHEASDEITIRNFAATFLSPEAVLVTYQSFRSGALNRSDLRSSIWIFRDERWQVLFHQGTRVTAINNGAS